MPILLVILLLLAGCAGLNDKSASLTSIQEEYCQTADPNRRAVLLAIIRMQVPGYPPSGLCTDAEKELAEHIADQVVNLPEVDFEQAREDQRRFQDESGDPTTALDGEILRSTPLLDSQPPGDGDSSKSDGD